MNARDLRKLLRAEPFEPVRLGLSDGRSVLIRHSHQVVVSDRHVYVGLAKLKRSAPLATPRRADAPPKDWLWINILHVVSVEPANGRGNAGRRPATRRRSTTGPRLQLSPDDFATRLQATRSGRHRDPARRLAGRCGTQSGIGYSVGCCAWTANTGHTLSATGVDGFAESDPRTSGLTGKRVSVRHRAWRGRRA
jgi:hypothetical protein